MAEVNINRLDHAFERLQAYPQRDSALDNRFRDLILNADDDTLNRINAYALAAFWNTDAHSLLVWLLYSSQVGLFDLHWETHCTHCNGSSNITVRLGTIGHDSSCKMCQVDFPVHSDENVEVTFTVNRSIRATSPSLESGLPDGAIAIGQWDATRPIELKMDQPGQYFLTHLESGKPGAVTRFDVREDQAPRPEMTVAFYPETASPAQTLIGPGTTTVTISGTTDIIGIYRDDTKPLTLKPRVTGLDVLLTPDFKSVFAHDTLSQRESLSVKSLTILFTDITGSTALYKRLGDIRAYNLVRDHFDVLFQEIEFYHGIIVKTIGDAVMAAFPSPDDALQAALAVQHSIAQFNETRTSEEGVILVKIGLHSGSAIAVNLNNTLDYFGNMVNLAARIQSKSRSEEILMSEAAHQDPDVQQILTTSPELVVTDSIFELHGIGEQRLYSVMVQ